MTVLIIESLVKIYHMQKTNFIYREQSTQLIHILRIMYQLQRLYVIMKDKRIIAVMYDDVETYQSQQELQILV
jgi:hypothetical protein